MELKYGTHRRMEPDFETPRKNYSKYGTTRIMETKHGAPRKIKPKYGTPRKNTVHPKS